MMRGIVENLFHPERLERLFQENAVTQYTRRLPFATLAEVMGEVVFNVNPSVGAAGTFPGGVNWGRFCVALLRSSRRVCDFLVIGGFSIAWPGRA
jgi:hypothetical protein